MNTRPLYNNLTFLILFAVALFAIVAALRSMSHSMAALDRLRTTPTRMPAAQSMDYAQL